MFIACLESIFCSVTKYDEIATDRQVKCPFTQNYQLSILISKVFRLICSVLSECDLQVGSIIVACLIRPIISVII